MNQQSTINNQQSEDPVTQSYPTGPFIKLILWATLVAIGIPAAIYFVYTAGSGSKSEQSSLCFNNLTELTSASLLYAADHDETLPSGAWSQALKPYVKASLQSSGKAVPSEADILVVFACPVQRRINPQTFGYALFQGIAGKAKPSVPYPDQTALVFDSSNIKLDATEDLTTLPVPGRHQNGRRNNVSYLDGHVKAVPAR